MNIGILLYYNCSMWSVMGAYEMLSRANRAKECYLVEKPIAKKFNLYLITADKKVNTTFPFPLEGNCNIENHPELELLIVPGFVSHSNVVLKQTKGLATWLQTQHQKGVVLASICSGSLLLAQAGLLENREATTHWMLKEYFEYYFPDVKLDISKIIIDHSDVLMSGSANLFQNLMVYIIEKYMGRSIAVGISKMYLIDWKRDTPESYMHLVTQKAHNDIEISKAQKYIHDNTNGKLSLDHIAQSVLMSKRTFIRRFKKATNETPLNYIHKVKVEKAKQILESERCTFEEIAFNLGYEDVNAFRKIFTKHTGISPIKYRVRYQLQ